MWSYLDDHTELFDVRLDERDRRFDHASLRVRVQVPVAGELRCVEVTDGGDAAYGAAAGGISSVAAPSGGCLYCEVSKKKGEWFDDAAMAKAPRRTAWWRSLCASHINPYFRLPADTA